MISTVVLHDGESQDWGDPKAFEGERISPAVQFWGFHLQGLRSDLYSSLPPQIAQPMLAKIFGESLGILTVRYCQVSCNKIEHFRISESLNTITSRNCIKLADGVF